MTNEEIIKHFKAEAKEPLEWRCRLNRVITPDFVSNELRELIDSEFPAVTYDIDPEVTMVFVMSNGFKVIF